MDEGYAKDEVNLMIRTTVVGSWPPAEEFAEALQQYHQGEMESDLQHDFLSEVAELAIDQQCLCGLDEYTGGETSSDYFILHFPKCLSGVEPTENREAWDGRGTYRVVGEIGAPNGLGIASAFLRERAIDPDVRKVTFPGPSEITMRIEPDEEGERIWPQVIDLIRCEMQECIDLGATDLQLDLPHIAMGLVDQANNWTTDKAIAIIRSLFAEFSGIRRSVHFCYGDFGAQTWTKNRNFAPLLPTIQALDGVIDRVVLEFSLPEQWADRALLAQIPASIEIAAGIIDVKSPRFETVAEVQAKIKELLRFVPAERLLICPSCGFGRRNTEMAIAKTTVMVEAAHRYQV